MLEEGVLGLGAGVPVLLLAGYPESKIEEGILIIGKRVEGLVGWGWLAERASVCWKFYGVVDRL